MSGGGESSHETAVKQLSDRKLEPALVMLCSLAYDIASLTSVFH
jgi:hypothetical protein